MAVTVDTNNAENVQQKRALRALRNADRWSALTAAQRWEIVRRVLVYLLRKVED